MSLKLGAGLLAPLFFSCSARPTAVEVSPADAESRLNEARVVRLRPVDRELRERAANARGPGSGADPWAIQPLSGTGRARFVGLLRGLSAVVLLDDELAEVARAPAPAGAMGLAVSDDAIVVAGELSPELRVFAVERGEQLALKSTLRVPDADGFRAVAIQPDGTLGAVDPRAERLRSLAASQWRRAAGTQDVVAAATPICRGAFEVVAAPGAFVVACSSGHAVDVVRAGRPDSAPVRINLDGPFFGVTAAALSPSVLTVAAGAVEDHPLDRTQGSFGFVDSFVYVARVDLATGGVTRRLSINVSELGIVTPKVLHLSPSKDELQVAGYGTPDIVTLALSDGRQLSREPSAPGARAVAQAGDRRVFANPLLDAWVSVKGGRTRVVPVAGADVLPPRSDAHRVGEALIYTTLMAPWNKAEGRLSRFTCETCHFEGGTDGRVHHTGRENVHATTKPILGLVNNRPHFSRALDGDLAELAMNEFRAANAKSEHDPYFAVSGADAPWLSHLGVTGARSAEDLRIAFMTYLAETPFRPNGRALRRSQQGGRFSESERRGAELFKQRCEGCHQAKLSSDGSERVPFEQWERYVLSADGPLVWADARYEKTGVVPYVHERGARVPSLRRVYAKWPYFTNGSAQSLGSVLEQVRIDEAGFRHDARQEAGAKGTLRPDERDALRAFLELL